ncbi:hypothetical protein RP20_CCG010268 [Aedes albopictus]|nr:hypothetical protein RP20_CCG010268 [Aedes albopictus]
MQLSGYFRMPTESSCDYNNNPNGAINYNYENHSKYNNHPSSAINYNDNNYNYCSPFKAHRRTHMSRSRASFLSAHKRLSAIL